jgi:hypothetical protein
MKGLTVNAQLFLFLRVDVVVGGMLFLFVLVYQVAEISGYDRL